MATRSPPPASPVQGLRSNIERLENSGIPGGIGDSQRQSADVLQPNSSSAGYNDVSVCSAGAMSRYILGILQRRSKSNQSPTHSQKRETVEGRLHTSCSMIQPLEAICPSGTSGSDIDHFLSRLDFLIVKVSLDINTLPEKREAVSGCLEASRTSIHPQAATTCACRCRCHSSHES